VDEVASARGFSVDRNLALQLPGLSQSHVGRRCVLRGIRRRKAASNRSWGSCHTLAALGIRSATGAMWLAQSTVAAICVAVAVQAQLLAVASAQPGLVCSMPAFGGCGDEWPRACWQVRPYKPTCLHTNTPLWHYNTGVET